MGDGWPRPPLPAGFCLLSVSFFPSVFLSLSLSPFQLFIPWFRHMPAVSLQIFCQPTPPPVCLASLSLSSSIFFVSPFPHPLSSNLSLLLRYKQRGGGGGGLNNKLHIYSAIKHLRPNDVFLNQRWTTFKPQFHIYIPSAIMLTTSTFTSICCLSWQIQINNVGSKESW